jgi:hypothetical protein
MATYATYDPAAIMTDYPSLFIGALGADEFRITILTRTRFMCVILKPGMQPMLRDEGRVATAVAHRKNL